MSIFSCFENAIGLSRTEDDCVDVTYDPQYSESLSGLYVDELPGMSLRMVATTDNSTSLWEKMQRARENAINTFKTDLMQELFKYNEPSRTRFTGDIGGRGFQALVTSSTYYGLRMYSDVRGGKFILRGISLILNTTEAVNLLVYDDYDLLYTIALTSEAGRPHRTDITAIEFDLSENYYFLISPVGQPYSNKLTCGCGGYKWCFDPDHACYKTSRDKWTEWAMIGGVSGTDITLRDDWTVCKNANGMILHGNFTCNFFDALCNEDADFLNNEIDTSMAWAILYKTGEFLSNYILDTGEVSRYSLLGKENLLENRAYYNARYAVMVNYIAGNMDVERNDCLRCRPAMGMTKRLHLI